MKKKGIILIRIFLISMILISTSNIIEAQEIQENNQASENTQSSFFDENPNNIEETLIDFTTFEEKIKSSGIYSENDDVRTKNISNLTKKELDTTTLAPAYEIQSSDLNYENWLVQFNSSANTVKNKKFSYAKKVELMQGKNYKGGETEAGKPEQGVGNTVLGVRIHFPTHKHNSYARISPPFELKAYDNEGHIISTKESGKSIGVIYNVGKIKKMTIDVSGRNFKNAIGIRLKDQFDNIKEYFMGYAYHVNWRRLAWENSNYTTHVNHRQIFRVPLYPQEIPYKKFDSIIIYRPGEEVGGDFIAYFRKIDLWFDFAVAPEILNDLDIDDEKAWKILSNRAKTHYKNQKLKYREKIELLKNEKSKMNNKNLKETNTSEEKITEKTTE